MLIYFILRLKNYIYNISLEIHLASSGKNGFLAKHSIYIILVLK